MIKTVEYRPKNEAELRQMTKNKSFLRNRWRGRVALSADKLAKTTDPKLRRKYEYMFSRQRMKLNEHTKEAQR